LIRNFRPSSFIDPAGIVGSLPNVAEVTGGGAKIGDDGGGMVYGE